MPVTFQLIRGSTTWNISESDPIEVTQIKGLGVAAVSVITEQGPLQDGDTDRDIRLEPRMITMLLQIQPDVGVYDYEEGRALFNKIFTPSSVPLILRTIWASGNRRDIVVRPLGIPELPTDIDQTILTKAGIQLRAANPLFFDPTAKQISFALAGGGSAFTIPMFVPTSLGTASIDQTVPVAYAGTWRDYPLITLTGPCNNPVLTNQTTGDTLDFTGLSLAGGDTYTIDLRYGRKIVYKNGNINDVRNQELTTDSDLATFCVEADPNVANGANSFRFTATGVNNNTQIYMLYYENYTGI